MAGVHPRRWRPVPSVDVIAMTEPTSDGVAPPRDARPLELGAVFVLMTALTAVMLYPQVRHLDSVADRVDPLFSIWRLAWVAHQLPVDPAHFYDANIFHPEPYALAYSDGMPLTAVVAAPFIWLGIRTVVVYNLFVLASFVLSGLAMYVFVRSLAGNALAAVVSGVAFAFYPFRFEHFVHLELLSAFWMPLSLWALHRTLSEPAHRWRMGLLTGVALAAQYLSGMYFGVFLGAYLAVVGGGLLLARGRAGVASLKPLLAGALLAGVLVLPTLPPYLHVRQAIGDRPRAAVQIYSAQPSDYLAIHHPLPRSGGCNERQVFPGVLIVVLALVAVWPPVHPVRVAYLVGLAMAFELSLGSNGILYPFLYDWCLPFRGLRAPARYSMLVGLSLAVLAGFGAARLIEFARSRLLRIALAAVLCAVILAEPRPPVAVEPLPIVPEVYRALKGRPVSAIADLPMLHAVAAQYVYYSTFHWLPIVNGYSGALPKSYRPIHFAVQSFPDDASLSALRAYGVSHVVLHEEFYGDREYRDVIARVERRLELVLVSQSTDGPFESRVYALFR
jgi:hypothetical protein